MNFSIEKTIKLLRRHFLLVLAVALLFSAAFYYYKKNNSVPVYTAYAELYVVTKAAEDGYMQAGISAERNYVSTYIEMLKTVKYSQSIYDFLDPDDQKRTSAGSIYNSLYISSKNETEIITIRVYNTDKELALRIADVLERAAESHFANLKVSIDDVSEADAPRFAGVSTVSYKKSVIMGFIIGAFVCFFIIFVKDLYDYRLRSASEIKERYGLPVLGSVPTFDNSAFGERRSSPSKGDGKK
ncbi:MAG: hypothetical protein IKK83_06920 [Clostridia bacterium]|nr:hypothetical protein [Clostridia bacterium]